VLTNDGFVAHVAARGAAGLYGEPITFEQFAALIAHYTPARSAELAGVPEDSLRALARFFADPSKRITSLWCMGVNQHNAGTAMNNLIHAVHLVSGTGASPAMGPQSLTGQPSACGTVREVGTLAHALPAAVSSRTPSTARTARPAGTCRPGA
jgi:nitrate reductase NapA